MSDEKNKYNRAYDEGYNEGKEDDALGNFVQELVKGYPPSFDPKERESYNTGYDDGASDKNDSSNSHYSGGTSESNSDCFITTATLASIGKADNCIELNSFRDFRDHWLLNEPDGQRLVAEYYNIAPKIVAAIDSDPYKSVIYKSLWNQSIQPCLKLIEDSRFEEAKAIYCEVVTNLKLEYLKKSS